jgi:hypothetical protein
LREKTFSFGNNRIPKLTLNPPSSSLLVCNLRSVFFL